MQGFRAEWGKNKFWFCSYACADEHGITKADGEWDTENEYPESEQCANCNIHLNDAVRAEKQYEVNHA